MPDSIIVEHFAVGPLGCTCTIVADTAAGEAIVVDGGDEPERIAARLTALGVKAHTLVHSHAHVDHIGCLATLRELTNGSGLLHPADLPLYATLPMQARFLGTPPPRPATIDGDLRDGDVYRAGAARLEVLHTPGHTPGSVSFALTKGEDQSVTLLTGDTLFAGAIGRWDLGGTSMHDIVTSIKTKLYDFSDDTVVVPGHGPRSTIGIERQTNPYLCD